MFYYKGDKAKYTGESDVIYGARFFEIVMTEGHNKGKKFSTFRCPDCEMQFGQDKRVPCPTCDVNVKIV